MLHQLLSVFDLLESFDLGVSVETHLPQCYQTKGFLWAHVQEREDAALATKPVWNTRDDRDSLVWFPDPSVRGDASDEIS